MAKIRRTLNAPPEFLARLRQIQGKIQSENEMGVAPSLTDITQKIIRTPAFEEVERQILNGENIVDKLNFKIKFDKKL